MFRNPRVVVAVAACVLAALVPLTVSAYWLDLITLGLIYALGVFSLNLLIGTAGLLSFGQAGFVGIGAYFLGVLSVNGMNIWLAALIAVAAAALAGLLVALPSIRLSRFYLFILTMGFGIVVSQLLDNLEITRGPRGLLGIPNIGLTYDQWYWAVLVVVVLTIAGLSFVRNKTELGLMLRLMRADEVACRSCGVNTFALKVGTFTASAGLAGLSGVLLAMYLRFLSPDLFNFSESFRLILMTVVGGPTSYLGGLLTSVILTALPEVLRAFGESNLRLMIYGAAVFVVFRFFPAGIGGLIDRLWGAGGEARAR